MRLIDADKLIRTVRFLTLRDGKEIEIHYVEAERIDSAPTIDAIPVTRCKDCRHYTGKWCTIYSTKQFDANDIYKDDDDFCSQAEREEE